MEVWVIVLLLLMYGVLEFLASFSFNFKIKMIGNSRYTSAAFLGAFSTIIFVFLTSLAPYIAITSGAESVNGDMWWFILLAGFMMMIGNASSILVFKYIKRPNKNDKTKNKEEKK